MSVNQYLINDSYNPESEELVQDLNQEEDLSKGNPLIIKMIREALTQRQASEEKIRPEMNDLDRNLAYTRKVEEGKKPGLGRLEVNKTGKRPTTGSYHIEQRVFAENIREREGEDAFKFIKNMNSDQFIKFIHENPEKEEEVAAHLIDKLARKYGSKPIVDSRGDTVPAWRAAYSHGETGLKRLLKKNKYIAEN